MKRYIFNLLLLLGITVFFGIQLQAQEKANTVQIQGKVLDETGNPVSSAKIYLNNGAKVAYSSADGSYTINMVLAEIAVIEASGFEPVRLNGITLRSKSDITLLKKPHGLRSNDLVKVPFGTLYSRQLTGAVTVINAKETMKYDKTENVQNVVNGRVPGLFGTVSNRSNTDVYSGVLNETGNMIAVVDGVPRVGYNLNLSEVETVTVLRDITSRALYGAQALNGVILITTKRGEANKRELNFAVERGIADPISFPEFLNSADYMEYYNQAARNDGVIEKYSADAIANTRSGVDKLRYPDEDYYNSTYLKSMGHFTNVIGEASGGNSNAQYYLNMGWKNSARLMNEEIWAEDYKDGVNTFNIRGNVDYKINDFMKMSIDGIVFYETDNQPRFSGTSQNFYTRASTFLPNYYPVLIDASLLSADQQLAAKIVNGQYVLGGTSEYKVNIYGDMAKNGYLTSVNRILQNNTSLDFDLGKITEGLSAKVYLTFDMNNNYSRSLGRTYSVYQPVYTPAAVPGDPDVLTFTKPGVDTPAENPQVSNVGFFRRFALSEQINYVRNFNDIHKVNITALSYLDNQAVTGTLQPEKNLTFALRANYMFKDKYVAEANIVTTGSVKLDKNKWGTSPAFGLGWIISEESFLKDNSFVNYLKLRANWGKLKTDQYSAYRQYMNYYSSPNTYYYGFAAWNNGSRAINAGNTEITWTDKEELSFGFESFLMKDKLQLEATYFSNTLSGIPLQLSNIYPAYVERPWENYGEYTDEGVEWGLKYNVKIGKVLLTIGHNAVYSSPIRVKDNVVDYSEAWRKRTGVATDAIFGLEADGFYTAADFNPDGTLVSGLALPVYGEVKKGDIRYVDQNSDGFVNQKDEMLIGNSTSRFQYGLNMNLKAGNFELFLLGTGQTGAEKIYSSDYYWVYGDRKYSDVVRNSWTDANAATADYPRLSTKNSPNNFQNSTFWMKKDVYFTLHTAQLTYNLPFATVQKAYMKSMQLYLRGTNLFTISENKDRRELNTASQPQMRYYSVGVTANF